MNARKSRATSGPCIRTLSECALLVLVATATLASTTAVAATYTSVQIDGIDGGLVNKSSTLSNAPIALSGTGTGVRGGTTSASAAANATEGLLIVDTLAASTAISHINSTTSANAYATARWSDVITIDAGALNGNFGYINALIDVSGGIGGMASPVTSFGETSDANMQISVYGPGYSTGPYPTVFSATASGAPGNSSTSAIDPITDLIVRIPVVFGYGTTIGFQLDAFSKATTNTYFSSSGDIDAKAGTVASLRWAGITGVFRNDDSALTNFTVRSESGLDYSVAVPALAVPEPSVIAMLLAGLGMLGVAAHRRREAT